VHHSRFVRQRPAKLLQGVEQENNPRVLSPRFANRFHAVLEEVCDFLVEFGDPAAQFLFQPFPEGGRIAQNRFQIETGLETKLCNIDIRSSEPIPQAG